MLGSETIPIPGLSPAKWNNIKPYYYCYVEGKDGKGPRFLQNWHSLKKDHYPHTSVSYVSLAKLVNQTKYSLSKLKNSNDAQKDKLCTLALKSVSEQWQKIKYILEMTPDHVNIPDAERKAFKAYASKIFIPVVKHTKKDEDDIKNDVAVLPTFVYRNDGNVRSFLSTPTKVEVCVGAQPVKLGGKKFCRALLEEAASISEKVQGVLKTPENAAKSLEEKAELIARVMFDDRDQKIGPLGSIVKFTTGLPDHCVYNVTLVDFAHEGFVDNYLGDNNRKALERARFLAKTEPIVEFYTDKRVRLTNYLDIVIDADYLMKITLKSEYAKSEDGTKQYSSPITAALRAKIAREMDSVKDDGTCMDKSGEYGKLKNPGAKVCGKKCVAVRSKAEYSKLQALKGMDAGSDEDTNADADEEEGERAGGGAYEEY